MKRKDEKHRGEGTKREESEVKERFTHLERREIREWYILFNTCTFSLLQGV
jgi:hypothetical protein